MKIKELISYLEQIAPPVYQESYDNSGLIVGNANTELTGVMICLDSTEAVLEEAKAKNCNLVVAHHPIVFKGLKKITGKNYVERVVIKAIKEDIAVYAIHTNLDNMYNKGVNAKIAERLGLQFTKLLAEKTGLKKLSIEIPEIRFDRIKKAALENGAIHITPRKAIGAELAAERYIATEVIFPIDKQAAVLKAIQSWHLKHRPEYHTISTIENRNPVIGSGMFGHLPEPMEETAFLEYLKEKMQINCIRHTKLLGKPIRKVAVCGGAGGFLLNKAKAKGADIFITSDYKYHEFFDADGQIIIADIGHYESEQFTVALLHEIISEKFSNFAAYCTSINTNPVYYI